MGFIIFLLVCAVVALFFYTLGLSKKLELLGKRLKVLETPTPETRPGKIEKGVTPAPPLKESTLPIPKIPPKPVAIPVAAKAATPEAKVLPSQPATPPPFLGLPFLKNVSLEQFLGVKLFAWIGGLVFFLAVVFFIKYSFDQGLISPAVRIVLGYLMALALVVGGLWLSRGRFAVTGKSLTGVGLLIIYAVTMAAHGLYHFVGAGPAFALMALNTLAALVVSVRLSAPSIAILGLLGGFLTPPLLGSGEDKPFALFGYIALLDLGLLGAAFFRRWGILILLSAIATLVMLWGWAGNFFGADKLPLAIGLYLFFVALFAGAAPLARRLGMDSVVTGLGTVILALGPLGLSWGVFIGHWDHGHYLSLLDKPAPLLAMLLVADLLILAAVLFRPRMHLAFSIFGAAVFFTFAVWLAGFISVQNMVVALVFNLILGTLHTGGPLLFAKWGMKRPHGVWLHLFSLGALFLYLIPMVAVEGQTFSVWPFVLVADLGILFLALALGSWLGVLLSFLITVFMAGFWLVQIPTTHAPVTGMLTTVLLLAGVFAAASAFLLPKLIKKQQTSPVAWEKFILPLPSLLPFLLLCLIALRLPLESPHRILGALLIYEGVLLALSKFLKADLLPVSALLGMVLVAYAWGGSHLSGANGPAALLWALALPGLLFAYPLLFLRGQWDRRGPWVASALALPLMVLFMRKALKISGWDDMPGLLPLSLSLFPLGALFLVIRLTGKEPLGVRHRLMALFGGASLFFITLIFPMQFEKQWLTVAWALEGAALLWLFTRVPHLGLKWTGLAFLAVVFIRLGLNPWVFKYHPRSDQVIFNYYLYTYGLAILSMAAGAWWMRGQTIWGKVNPTAVLAALGTVLAFLLLNIEIADFFSTGSTLTFRFNGSVGQDMTYSIAWGLFASAVLWAGFRMRHAVTRYVGLALVVITLLKLFLHDLFRLGGLYRIGSLIGLAVVLIALSFAYQKFFAAPKEDEKTPSGR